jgi:tetratricopeptide (TPR) repeat protein
MRIAAVVLAATVGLPCLGQTSLIGQGRAALDRDEPGRAIELLEKAVDQNPASAEAHGCLGVAYGSAALTSNIVRRMSLAQKARCELEKAVQLDPAQVDARIGLLEYYTLAPRLLGGDIEKAREQANLIKSRDLIGGHRAHAFIDAHLNQIDLARKEFRDAVAEQPLSAKSHYWLGSFYEMTDKNYPAASAEFETAARLDPTDMLVRFEIGHLAALTGIDLVRGQAALIAYLNHKPAKDEPSLDRAAYWLGAIFEKRGNETAAREQYADALRVNPKQKDVMEAMARLR